jgi:fructuronate reductase
MTARRLNAASLAAATADRPRYDRDRHGVGIIHLGIGAFHRAHQAVYTDDALAASGGDWRIRGVSLRGTDVADALNPQDGLYTLLVKGEGGTQARIIGSVAGVLAGPTAPEAVRDTLVRPETRIVSITVTEKAYGIDRASGKVDLHHPAIAHDLAHPEAPTGTIGLIIQALRRRRLAGIAPFTVLCCDNLPKNGALLRSGTLDFAGRIDAGLRDWIAETVPFPSTMVDRITPAATDATFALAERETGLADRAAVETEPFSQWVIEDRFATGRPDWEAGGAILVDDVEPYELMKLRMLNGSHSMLAYAGFLASMAYVRDVMADAVLARLVHRHLAAAASTLRPVQGIDLDDYAEALCHRFANPAIAHETYQIAMDGTEKLPQRLLLPALETLEAGGDIRPYAFAVAAWMRYCLGRRDDGSAYALRDPREARIAAIVARDGGHPPALASSLMAMDGLFPDRLRADAGWNAAVSGILARMCEQGMAVALSDEVGHPVAGGGRA